MRIVSITAKTYPYDRLHDLYQQFYRSALRAICEAEGITYKETSGAYSDTLLRTARKVRHSYKLGRIVPEVYQKRAMDAIGGLMTRDSLFANAPVGSYDVLTDSGQTFNLCIDAHDSRFAYAQMVGPADIYFKTNYWPSHDYPEKVVPLQNLNPLVNEDRTYFRSFRKKPKCLDLFAFFRIWGGDDEIAGIEHNLLLIESLANIPCTKFVCAYLVAGNIAAISRRLERQGIRWTTSPMPSRELWEAIGSARLNIVRLGMHECIPWRMTDIFAMGGCPVIDYGPRTEWPHPLIENEHYLKLNASPEKPPPENMSERMMAWLNHPTLVESVCRNTAEYFDRYLEPIELGRDILKRTVEFIEARG